MKKEWFSEIDFSFPIKIQIGYKSQFVINDHVKKGDLLLVKENILKEVINYKQKFKINKSDVKGLRIGVSKGDFCRKGSALVEKVGLWNKEKIICPFDAKVLLVDDQVIELEQVYQDDVIAPFDGVVVTIDENELVIKCKAWQMEFESAYAKNVWGELIVNKNEVDVDNDWLDVSFKDRIVVVDQLTHALWNKVNALRVRGLIVNQVESTIEHWIDTGRDVCGLLIYNKDNSDWRKLISYLETLNGSMSFVLVDGKSLVVIK